MLINEHPAFAEGTRAAFLLTLTALASTSFLEPMQSSTFAALAVLLLLLHDRKFAFCTALELRWLGLLLAILCATSLFIAISPSRSIKGTGDLLRGLLLSLPVAWCARNAPEAFLRHLCIVAATTTIGLAALFHGFWPLLAQAMGEDGAWTYIASPFVSTNVASSVITLAMLVMCTSLLCRRPVINKRITAICLLAGLATLPMLASRGAMVAIVAAIPALFIVARPAAVRHLYAGGAVLTLAIIGLALLFPTTLAPLLDLIKKDGSVDSMRFPLYQQTLDAFFQKPLFGWGINNFKVSPYDVLAGRHMGHPHQIYLEILFSVGLAGATLAAGLVTRQMALISKKIDRKHILFPLAIALLLWTGARGMFDISIWHYSTSATLGLALGMLVGARPGLPGLASPQPPMRQ